MMDTAVDSVKQLREKSIARLQEYIAKIKNLQADSVAEVAAQLRGWEGVSSKIYFETINAFHIDSVIDPNDQQWTFSMRY